LQTYPEVLFRAVLAIELLAIVLVLVSLFFNARLKASPIPRTRQTRPKRHGTFSACRKLLHYFPPVVAGVLVPSLLIIALVVIPYFNINIEANGLFLKDRTKRLRLFYLAALGMLVFLLAFHVYVAVGPTVIVALAMIVAANSTPDSPSRVPSLSGPEAAGLLDHDMVSLRTHCAHRCGHMVPRPGLVLGFAMEELSAIH